MHRAENRIVDGFDVGIAQNIRQNPDPRAPDGQRTALDQDADVIVKLHGGRGVAAVAEGG